MTEPVEVLIKQGAEALAYKSTILPGLLALRKHRPPKPYRHPDLDKRLTKHRMLGEARLLQKCRKCGIPVPALYFLDEAKGDLWMEYIDGPTLRDVIATVEGNTQNKATGQLLDTMIQVGQKVCDLHLANIVHGDLTTSNLLVQREGEGEGEIERIVIIDLGLGSVSLTDEDKAVDLYVLERAFLSTHPRSTHLFEAILTSYAQHGGEAANTILKRLELVKLRGRKRTMVG